MRSTHHKSTFVPGARPVLQEVDFVYGAMALGKQSRVPVLDRKGRPVWQLPKPTSHAVHFKSAAHRRRFEAGELTAQQAKQIVAVYRGMDRATARAMNSKGPYQFPVGKRSSGCSARRV